MQFVRWSLYIKSTSFGSWSNVRKIIHVAVKKWILILSHTVEEWNRWKAQCLLLVSLCCKSCNWIFSSSFRAHKDKRVALWWFFMNYNGFEVLWRKEISLFLYSCDIFSRSFHCIFMERLHFSSFQIRNCVYIFILFEL